MTNCQQQSSFSIPIKSAEERAFLHNMYRRAEVALDYDRDEVGGNAPAPDAPSEFEAEASNSWGWHMNDSEMAVHFFAEESGNVEAMVLGLQEFLAKFRGPKDVLRFCWANTCSRPVTDSFDGGGVAFTATESKWINVASVVDEIAEEMSR